MKFVVHHDLILDFVVIKRYEGIDNALAVEIDTFFNYDQLDFYENHISVMTGGFRYHITANHTESLATTTRIPGLDVLSNLLSCRMT